jgi:general secretion pathway protein D
MEVIQVFDQPIMSGQRTKRITRYFGLRMNSASALLMFSAEGYAASTNIAAGSPILVLSIAPINSVVIFASSDKTLDHILKWARELIVLPIVRQVARFLLIPLSMPMPKH